MMPIPLDSGYLGVRIVAPQLQHQDVLGLVDDQGGGHDESRGCENLVLAVGAEETSSKST